MTNIDKLVSIMKDLRNPENGCPWDLQQNFSTIAPYTIEEAYEVADAIERDNMGDLEEELGDLLFQVVFHAQLATERKAFSFDDVVTVIVDKMIRRHPHVFGGDKIEDADQQAVAWEAHKAAERGRKVLNGAVDQSILEGIPIALPGLTRAVKLQKRVAQVGFDWTNVSDIFEKIREELSEVEHEVQSKESQDRIEEEIGDLFFAVSNLARRLNVDPEKSLRVSNSKFERRFRSMEELASLANAELKSLTLDEQELLYQQVKSREKTDDKGN